MFPTFLEDFSAFWHKVSQAGFVLFFCLTSPLNQPFLQEATASFSWECAVCLVTQLRLTLCDSMHCSLPGSSLHGDSPGKNTRVGCHALLQGIFPTEGSNPGLLHCRRILYQLSYPASLIENRIWKTESGHLVCSLLLGMALTLEFLSKQSYKTHACISVPVCIPVYTYIIYLYEHIKNDFVMQ